MPFSARCFAASQDLTAPAKELRSQSATWSRPDVDLVVTGAGPSYTDRPGATGAAYLVRADGHGLLLDLGQGSFPGLAGRLDPADLDAILVSHLHPDHFIDLVSLRHYLRWQPPRGRRVRVIGPAGLGDRIDALHAEPGFSDARFIDRIRRSGAGQ